MISHESHDQIRLNQKTGQGHHCGTDQEPDSSCSKTLPIPLDHVYYEIYRQKDGRIKLGHHGKCQDDECRWHLLINEEVERGEGHHGRNYVVTVRDVFQKKCDQNTVDGHRPNRVHIETLSGTSHEMEANDSYDEYHDHIPDIISERIGEEYARYDEEYQRQRRVLRDRDVTIEQLICIRETVANHLRLYIEDIDGYEITDESYGQ